MTYRNVSVTDRNAMLKEKKFFNISGTAKGKRVNLRLNIVAFVNSNIGKARKIGR